LLCETFWVVASVRVAQNRDLPDILRLYAQPEIDDGATPTVEEASVIFERIARYPNYRVFVAEDAGRIVGTFALLIMDNLGHLGALSAIVEDVAVDPDMHRRGIGKIMMDYAMQECRTAGCYKMMLSSNAKRGDAHAFYDSLGFERHGYSFRVGVDAFPPG
jgi:GNAT superfamily N-acetyltransferase